MKNVVNVAHLKKKQYTKKIHTVFHNNWVDKLLLVFT